MAIRIFRFALVCAIACLPGLSAAANDLLATYRAALQNDPVFQSAEFARLANIEVRAQAESALMPQVTLDANVARNETNNDQRGNYGSNSLGY